jgi:hypothetical protein
MTTKQLVQEIAGMVAFTAIIVSIFVMCAVWS